MPFLLMVFLVLICMPDADTWPRPPFADYLPPWMASPQACVALTWLAVALTGLNAFLVARRMRRLLELDPAQRERLLYRYERGRFHHQIGLFVMYILVLLVFGWGWSVSHLWSPLPGAELLILAPFVVAQMLAWSVYYDAERASHQAAHRLLAADAQAGTW